MMAAPIGNNFYLLRSKSGRNKKFNKPEALLQACYEYFESCDSNPWYKNEAIKSGDMTGTIIQVPTARPYTLRGLYVFIGIDRKTWDAYSARKDFTPITTHVEDIIYTQKFEGAAVGAFNANIIARELGLSEKTEVVTEYEVYIGGKKLSSE
jgi:hypothetical protein